MPTNTPQPQAVDYSGRPLTEGDPVAFLSHDPLGLTAGHIRVISAESICIATGAHLITFDGMPASLAAGRPRPIGGTVARDEGFQEPFRYPLVALQPAEGEKTVTVHVGSLEVSEAAQRDVARHMDRVIRTQRDGA